MDKLLLIQPLKLEDKDIIHLLIDGISHLSIKSAAAIIHADSVDQFLDEMHHITTICDSSLKKNQSSGSKFEKSKNNLKFNKEPPSSKNLNDSNEKDNSQKQELFCVYCRNRGHLRDDCLKLKKKEQFQKSGSAKPQPSIAAVIEEPTETTPVIALIDEDNSNRITVDNMLLKVVQINNTVCDLVALLDSGSPVSFIGPSVFNKFFRFPTVFKNNSKQLYKALNNTPISTYGLISSSLQLKDLPNLTVPIELHVLENNFTSADLIIGRDFLANNKISVTMNFSKKNLEDRIELFNEIASADILETPIDNSKIFENMEIDFDSSSKEKLISTIQEIDSMSVTPVEDEYTVKIALKDDSVFAFAPRKFAWAERLQLRDITDDLLKRNIIKHSTSPYCSRVVPIRKKNGSIRLCADLRPLNSRIIKQRYPFPLIEDCLSRLSNKNVFSLLDLKDGFHNIKIHPEYTKYFAFVTPDGQFEYVKLPFGYSEAPAEFQRRLIQILQSLIREEKIIVYMDDILVPSISVEDNLSVLKMVMMLLRKHNLQLNYEKCLFLRKSVEYLGYMISPQGISLSSRHIEAVKNFPMPQKIVEVQRFLGLSNYFRKFIFNYATKAKPLTDLLKKSSFKIDEKAVLAFESLKKELVSAPTICIYNPHNATEIHTDASSIAIAGILLQKQKSNNFAPIAYYSQRTNEAEKNYQF
ncbi:hypothetical protein RF55_12857 [Lasius niger]|uniref:RNA-directed DNA polymerase n=1 Tax=Lasius niger TaxID=67767 RepID=A0A0J7KC12_LASNI|nr:hypothetical protein RF55_12857 [Lasius niger]